MTNAEEYLNSVNKRAEELRPLRLFAAENYIPIIKQSTEKLLFAVTAMTKPKKILEIGTAIGYSGLIMLRAHKDAELVTIEKEEDFYEMAYDNFEKFAGGGVRSIIQKMGDAIEILPTLKDKFDLIFLDGPKAQYIKFLPYLVDLLTVGGVLFADDVLFMGMVQGKIETPVKKRSIVKNLQRFNEAVAQHPQLESVMLDIEDGISLSVKMFGGENV
ncbi:MAG: O-methyltransferase [Christensenellaceae bacterium]|jgi:predicted O-methyltransferase YrrM|nr:O-methyltransferase [Christensenellaceae bacterium]